MSGTYPVLRRLSTLDKLWADNTVVGMPVTKAEGDILTKVRGTNAQGALAGLGVDPFDPSFRLRKNRFIARLYEEGRLAWVPWSRPLGAGWMCPNYYAISPAKRLEKR